MKYSSLYCTATTQISDRTENAMSTATMTQAPSARQQIADTFGKIRTFAIEMYQAHGGWFVLDAGQPASAAVARSQTISKD
jgi:predicted sugar kinase